MFNKLLFSLFLVLFALFIIPTNTLATTITVCSSGCDHTTIADAVSASTHGDTISVMEAGVYPCENVSIDGNSRDGLVVMKNSAVSGTVTFDASDSGRHFVCSNLSSTNTTFDGITFLDGLVAGDGGSIYCSGNFPGTIKNCVFNSNTAAGFTEDGGAFTCTKDFTGTIDNCTFSANTATNRGGAIFFSSFSNISGSITNCAFTSNIAVNGGGGMYLYISTGDTLSTDLENCTFTSNSTNNGNGGAINLIAESTTVIQMDFANCDFTTNLCGTTADNLDGGGIFIDSDGKTNQVFTNCTFTGNEACSNATAPYGDGGGMYFDSPISVGNSLTLTNCTFDQNIANSKDGSVRFGGAAYINVYTAYIDSCYFTDNEMHRESDDSPGMAAGLYISNSNDPNSYIRNTTFSGNAMIGDFNSPVLVKGGGVILSQYGGVFDDNIITRNKAGHGAGVYIPACNYIACSFDGNAFSHNCATTALSGDDINTGDDIGAGGGIGLQHNSLIISNCTFDSDSAGLGGAIRVPIMTNGISTILNCTFTNCVATDSCGGAISFSFGTDTPHTGKFRIVGCTIDGCSAADDGGGIAKEWDKLVDTTTVRILNTTISNCTAGRHGGGIMFLDTWAKQDSLYNVTVQNCIADSGGGGIYIQNDAPYMEGLKIIENSTVAGNGGGIYFANTQTSWSDTTFQENGIISSIIKGNICNHPSSAVYGGGIYVASGPLDITNTLIAKNDAYPTGSADNYGAGINFGQTYTDSIAATTLENVTIASNGNGGIRCSSGIGTQVLLLDNVIIANNSETSFEVSGTADTTFSCCNFYNNVEGSTEYNWSGFTANTRYTVFVNSHPLYTNITNASGAFPTFTSQSGLVKATNAVASSIISNSSSFALNTRFSDTNLYFLDPISPCLLSNYPGGISCGTYIGYTSNVGSGRSIGVCPRAGLNSSVY